jgi:hypothetical protein
MKRAGFTKPRLPGARLRDAILSRGGPLIGGNATVGQKLHRDAGHRCAGRRREPHARR